VEASVPGCVHLDLMNAGLLADPTLELNENDQHWIGQSEWTYEVDFESAPASGREQIDLAFDGLDTFAEVTLNGTVVGRTENQHRRYRFDVSDLIIDGTNHMNVQFASPVAVALRRRAELGDLPNPYGEPYNFVRKMASNFGWDWGPSLTTSGIWRPVRLERWSDRRIAALLVHPTLPTAAPAAGEAGKLDVTIDFDTTDTGQPEVCDVAVSVQSADGTVLASSSTPSAESQHRVSLDVPAVDRWWPVDRGLQPLYTVVVEVCRDDVVLDRTTRRIGFRHVELDTTPDLSGDGASFAFRVNGDKVWIRGFNWITDDCFPSRVTGDQLDAALAETVALNANLLRVWGGGIYEDDAFYDRCDELGLLVWQDFLFACAAYPEELLDAEVRAEAADNIERLMAHPSLLAWNANNENLWGWADWDWKDAVGNRTWGDGWYRDALPKITAELDPHRIYLDGSPTSLDEHRHPNSPDRGSVHIWDVWNDANYPTYRDHAPRFAAEFGFQAPATWSTLIAGIGTATPEIDGPELAHRQRAFDGHLKLDKWLAESFDTPTDFDDWLYLTQLVQAHAVTVGVGHLRSLRDRCSGVIWWQLNDCWPAISWSVLDSGGRRKPSWYAAREVLDSRLVAISPGTAAATITLVNDTTDAWVDSLDVTVLRDGQIAGSWSVPFDLPADTASQVGLDDADLPHLAESDVLVASAGHRRAVFQHGLRSADAAPSYDVDIVAMADGVRVTITATSLVRDLCIFADRVDPDASCDRQLVTVLPGEKASIEITTAITEAVIWRSALLPEAGPSVVLRTLGDRRRA